MENRNFQIQKDSSDKKKSKAVWKNIGIICLSVALALLTVVVISLNR